MVLSRLAWSVLIRLRRKVKKGFEVYWKSKGFKLLLVESKIFNFLQGVGSTHFGISNPPQKLPFVE